MNKICFLFLLINFTLFSQNWEQKMDLPGPGRDDGVAFSIGGIGYVVTGNDGGISETNKLWAYDPVTDSWSEKSPFPGIPRQYAGAFSLGNKGYILGGYSFQNQALKDLWQYTPATDSWVQKKDFEGAARWSFFQFVVNDFAFVGAGATMDSSLADCWKYDAQTDDWTQIADYPAGRMRHVKGISFGGKCFAGTGFNVNPLVFSKDFYAYDWQTNVWMKIDDFPGNAAGYVGAQGAGLHALVGGGWGQGGTFFSNFYYFSLDGKWQVAATAPIQGWRGMSTFSIEDEVFFFGGLYADLSRSNNLFSLEIQENFKPILFPNPATSGSFLYAQPNAEVKIYDCIGKNIILLSTDDSGYCVLPELASGQYVVHIVKSENLAYRLNWLVL